MDDFKKLMKNSTYFSNYKSLGSSVLTYFMAITCSVAEAPL